MPLRRGDTVVLDIDSAAYEGRAVARLDGFVVFVENAVPGDRVEALVLKTRKRYAEARTERLLEPSRDRVEPRCRHHETCGGCRWQNLAYPCQLEAKSRQVGELFQHLAHLQVEVRPTLPSPDVYDYRNKMEFSFGAVRWLTREEIESGSAVQRDFALGLHVPGRFDRVLDLQECHLQGELSRRLLSRVREFALAQGWTAYDTREHQGYLRNLLIRRGVQTGETMVGLVTSSDEAARRELFTERITREFPEVTTVLNIVNSTRSPVAAGVEIVTHGPGVIRERLGDHLFTIRPGTFFQTNTRQAENLFRVAAELAGFSGGERVYDLYCGVGAIALYIADRVSQVIGVELDPSSIEEARQNAEANQIGNCRFAALDSAEGLSPRFVEEHGQPDVVILDPPRAGLSPKTLSNLMELAPGKIVYISCNPATQARDLAELVRSYQIGAVQPVDMFPHTFHIENVVELRKMR